MAAHAAHSAALLPFERRTLPRRHRGLIVKSLKSMCAWTSDPPIPPSISGTGHPPIPALLVGEAAASPQGAAILQAKDRFLVLEVGDYYLWSPRHTVAGSLGP